MPSADDHLRQIDSLRRLVFGHSSLPETVVDEALVNLAAEHRVNHVVLATADDGAVHTTAKSRAHLEALDLAAERTRRDHLRSLSRMQDALAVAGLPDLPVFKGLALPSSRSGSRIRPVHDLDLLLAPAVHQDIYPVFDALELVNPDVRAVERLIAANRVFEFSTILFGVKADIHVDAVNLLVPCPSLLEHQAVELIGGQEISTFDPAGHLLIVAMNFWREGFSTLGRAHDIAELLDVPHTYERARRTARQDGIERLLVEAVSFVEQLCHPAPSAPPRMFFIPPETALSGRAGLEQMASRQSAVSLRIDGRRLEVLRAGLQRLLPSTAAAEVAGGPSADRGLREFVARNGARAARLRWSDLARMPVAALVLGVIATMLTSIGLHRTVSILRRLDTRLPRREISRSPGPWWRAVKLCTAATSGRLTCIPEALAAWLILRLLGFAPVVRLGVAGLKPFEAHAWVEVNETVLGTPTDADFPGADLLRLGLEN